MDDTLHSANIQDDISISVQGICKAYRIWRNPSARLKAPAMDFIYSITSNHSLPQLLKKQLNHRNDNRYYTDFDALSDISFNVRKGEAIGIVGRNGSGKSTLLQVICGTLTPTSGTVKVNGRIAALLELGSGFNPEFTGIENIYLNGAVLGLNKEQMNERLQDILKFAGIGPFVDQPIKTYSSGMVVRLAFAVQVSVAPDILIVDEALAVGDEAFQQKCFRRIEQLQQSGTTILFVSHDASSVINLCDRAIMLRNGKIFLEGSPRSVVTTYQKSLANDQETDKALLNDFHRIETSAETPTIETIAPSNEEPESSYFDPSLISEITVEYARRGARIQNARIINENGNTVNALTHGEMYQLRFETEFTNNAIGVKFGCKIKTINGIELCGTNTGLINKTDQLIQAGKCYTTTFKISCNLLPGLYTINVGVTHIHEGEEQFMDRLVDALLFRVNSDPEIKNHGYISLFSSVQTLEKLQLT